MEGCEHDGSFIPVGEVDRLMDLAREEERKVPVVSLQALEEFVEKRKNVLKKEYGLVGTANQIRTFDNMKKGALLELKQIDAWAEKEAKKK